MIQNFKNILFGLVIFSFGFSQMDSTFKIISRNFQNWQPIIEKKLNSSEKYFNYVWGDNYQFNKWSPNKLKLDSSILSETVSIIENKDLGYFIYVDCFSFSGDWYIAIDYYYNKKKQLYFIFWRMNTFIAEEPLTVEKRLYFDNNQQKIKELVAVYKMNTKEKVDLNFMDREVEYKLTLTEMDFYKYYKKN
jgi:hypothetical protein